MKVGSPITPKCDEHNRSRRDAGVNYPWYLGCWEVAGISDRAAATSNVEWGVIGTLRPLQILIDDGLRHRMEHESR